MADLHHGHTPHGHHHGRDSGLKVKDPVCGMDVDPTTSKHRAEHGGQTFHFCSARCHDKFVANPERYLKPTAKPGDPGHAEQSSPQLDFARFVRLAELRH